MRAYFKGTISFEYDADLSIYKVVSPEDAAKMDMQDLGSSMGFDEFLEGCRSVRVNIVVDHDHD